MFVHAKKHVVLSFTVNVWLRDYIATLFVNAHYVRIMNTVSLVLSQFTITKCSKDARVKNQIAEKNTVIASLKDLSVPTSVCV